MGVNYKMQAITGNTIRTVSGNYLNFLNPDPSLIEIDDIASGLCRICRFGGQLNDNIYYSVAEHSIHCTNLAIEDGITDKKILLSILLHDAAEAYCGDVVKPLKNIIGYGYGDIEKNIENTIAKAFDIDFVKNHDIIKYYDIEVLYSEVEFLFKDHMGVKETPKYIRKVCLGIALWDYMEAKKEFLNLYERVIKNEFSNTNAEIRGSFEWCKS